MVKKIHYCWFGGNPLNELAIKCINSWKEMCPDYEIIEWNEKNYDFSKSVYMKEAYENKKWAFVSDYARFDILFNEGGLYFDTDVELIKPIDDIVDKGNFMGFEKCSIQGRGGYSVAVNPGLGIGASAGCELYKYILDQYKERHFVREDGTFEQYTIVQLVTDILIERGLKNRNEIQLIGNIIIYPTDYFCPLDYETGRFNLTENSRSVHHYSASWMSKKEIQIHKFGQKMSRLFGAKIGYFFETLYGMPYQLKMKISILGFNGTIRFIFKRLLKIID